MTNPRIRNLLLPAALAVLAAVLVGIYVVSYRNNVNEGAGLVKVLVASRDIPAGTKGSSVAWGGYLKTESVPARARDGSVASAAPLTSKVTADPIYKGEQITLRQFAPVAQGGIFAKFSGKQRADRRPRRPEPVARRHVSTATVSTSSRPHGTTRGRPRDDARRPEEPPRAQGARRRQGEGPAQRRGDPATLVMTDSQAQTMGWAMKMSTWFLALRPTTAPAQQCAEHSRRCTRSSARGLPRATADAQIIGELPGGSR